jgi:hypothetical protein
MKTCDTLEMGHCTHVSLSKRISSMLLNHPPN